MAGDVRTRTLAHGLIVGTAFGALLERGGLGRFEKIADQFLLRDHAVLKTMGTASLLGGLGAAALRRSGKATDHVKPLRLPAVLAGGAIFGVGMALFGFCPGTSLAASASGRRDAVAGVAGMLAGALAFAEAYPALKRTILRRGNYGKVKVTDALRVGRGK